MKKVTKNIEASTDLIKSIEEVKRVRARDNLNKSSDGGSSGRSDQNDA